jgi:CIC family chloride channel protein
VVSFARILDSRFFSHPLLRKYTALVHEDLAATYSRDVQKWLLVAPIIGVVTGLVITLINLLILDAFWSRVLPAYLAHHWMILPGLLIGFIATGLIMQFRTPNPDLHSTEEIIGSYHDHQGDIDMRPFWWKLLAAVTTVASGGSAAMEGPSIYGGGAIGSWLWKRLRRFGLEPRDRRLMLISGAGAGMAAVFRAPLTGLVFALEMPYKDDLAHEALLPSLIASVVSYSTLVALVGSEPLFRFAGTTSFVPMDLLWSGALGVIIGIIAMIFDITFRRVRTFFVASHAPHTLKLAIGGLGTALCGLAFVTIYSDGLIPIGPNYEAVRAVLHSSYPTQVLLAFAILKMAASISSIASGGVSAIFVPLLLTGGCIGSAFAQSIVHSPTLDLYAAVGMAAFIAAGYKTPLAAVVFVAETTGGHSYIIPSLIGAAVAYAVSGEASCSGDQRLHELAKIAGLAGIRAREVMRKQVVSVRSGTTLRDFADTIAAHHRHTIFPVKLEEQVVGTLSVSALSKVPPEQWNAATVDGFMNGDPTFISDDCDLMEALRLLMREHADQVLLVRDDDGAFAGILTKTDILKAVSNRGALAPEEELTTG